MIVMRSVSRYSLAVDYAIDCITNTDMYGRKSYGVEVVYTTLEIPIESYGGITSPEEANACFKMLVAKYRGV